MRSLFKYSNYANFMVLGRGINSRWRTRARSIKEISPLHAEGYAAGELKHGPIAPP